MYHLFGLHEDIYFFGSFHAVHLLRTCVVGVQDLNSEFQLLKH